MFRFTKQVALSTAIGTSLRQVAWEQIRVMRFEERDRKSVIRLDNETHDQIPKSVQ